MAAQVFGPSNRTRFATTNVQRVGMLAHWLHVERLHAEEDEVDDMGRITTGFHRLGLTLALPPVLAAAASPVSQFFKPDGSPIPDPASNQPGAL